MKKAIFVITLTLVALVIAGSAIGCTGKTTAPTPTAPQPMDLIGVWSGTHVQSGSDWATYYNVTLNLTKQEGNMVIGTLVLTVLRRENSFSSDYNMDFVGQLSGNTLKDSMTGMTYQVSGNSMTGKGTNTSGTGPTAVTYDWSWNLTRVR